MVLDGVLDPAASGFEISLAQERAFGAALRAYLADCLSSSSCPFRGDTVDRAIDAVASLLLRLRASPVRAASGPPVNSAVFGQALYTALYSESLWPALTKAFAEIERGVSTTTFALANSYLDRTTSGHYTDNLIEAFYAIDCLDHPVSPASEVPSEAAQIAAVDPLRAADGGDTSFDAICRNWPVPATGKPHPVRAVGAPPIVLIGTTGDPATPYVWAQRVAEQLPGSRLITLQGQGHTAYPDHVACVNDPVDRFLLTGTLPTRGLTCRE